MTYAIESTEVERIRREAQQFYESPELAHISADRRSEVLDDIDRAGTYDATTDELLIGAKLAWRNHARCIGRMSWRALQMIDARDVRTAEEVAEVCWHHLRVSTNGGRIRPVITVFPAREQNGDHFRIWSPQLIRYAGYGKPDGSVVGDPLNAALTERVQRMGWRGAGTPFDVLPVVIQAPGEPPKLFDVPADAVLEVPITHPRLDWFGGLGLRWHANPAVSNMSLEVGGLSYPASPFSGWYVSSEIGARNLSDTCRYDMLPVIAGKMGLDVSTTRSLWKDRALVELNEAVLHSFLNAGVHIVDHHRIAQQFADYVDREHRHGRAVPAQWSWVNPPLSSSTTPTFHREYDPPNSEIRPNFVYQDTAPTVCPAARPGRSGRRPGSLAAARSRACRRPESPPAPATGL